MDRLAQMKGQLHEVSLVMSTNAKFVWKTELDDETYKNYPFRYFEKTDFTAPFAPGKQLIMVVKHTDGTQDKIKLNHTYNCQQIEWFKAGSALNLIRKQFGSN